MIIKIFEKYKHVRKYNKNHRIDDKFLKTLLEQTWRVTPSKNNFMPYNIHVLGPQHHNFKKEIYKICVWHEDHENSRNLIDEGDNLNPNYMNILDCSHLLVFTSRVEDELNPVQQTLHNNGIYLDPITPEGLEKYIDTVSLEVGMFANTLSALCSENNIQFSYTLCFKRDLAFWKAVSFVKNHPILLMTLGKGEVYRRGEAEKEGWTDYDYKPSFNKIVNFIN